MNAEGLGAARRYARYYIGDPLWADHIIHAYNNPAETNTLLDEEQA